VLISPNSVGNAFSTVALDGGASVHALNDGIAHADPRTTRWNGPGLDQPPRRYDVIRALG